MEIRAYFSDPQFTAFVPLYPSSFLPLKYNRPRDHGIISKVVVNSIRYSPLNPEFPFLTRITSAGVYKHYLKFSKNAREKSTSSLTLFYLIPFIDPLLPLCSQQFPERSFDANSLSGINLISRRCPHSSCDPPHREAFAAGSETAFLHQLVVARSTIQTYARCINYSAIDSRDHRQIVADGVVSIRAFPAFPPSEVLLLFPLPVINWQTSRLTFLQRQTTRPCLSFTADSTTFSLPLPPAHPAAVIIKETLGTSSTVFINGRRLDLQRKYVNFRDILNTLRARRFSSRDSDLKTQAAVKIC